MTSDIEMGTIGSAFDDFLAQQGMADEAAEQAVKRVLAFQLAESMKAQGITKVEMARRLTTSRSQLDRLLDPNNASVSLAVLVRAAKVLGRGLRLELS